MIHPAYVDYYCEKHEKSHQEDICPLCWYEQEFCEEHGGPQDCCKVCAEEYAADERRAQLKDERP